MAGSSPEHRSPTTGPGLQGNLREGGASLAGSRHPRSISTHLLQFAAALVLPVLIFSGVPAGYYVIAQRERVDERALSATRQLAIAVDRKLGSYLLMQQALATSPELQAGDIQGFYPRAMKIYAALGANIVLRAPGRKLQLMNSSVPWGMPLDGGNPDISASEQIVLRTKGAHRFRRNQGTDEQSLGDRRHGSGTEEWRSCLLSLRGYSGGAACGRDETDEPAGRLAGRNSGSQGCHRCPIQQTRAVR
ncbi:hypothetical protein [Labrys sp. ZIDIC5]|uniref:hypothetical protein n=1 Tax=Labrys sedimenti TaxID=3106036 RepID=UPI002ACA6A99|nr:hypothetical protein [Labrys sp. ZIDIC5]MDZ5454478.1 hypothetical protein [Labrys sp. ZIDIC5]